MRQYMVRLVKWGDYGETHFTVFAKDLHDAWRKAIEDAAGEKIDRIWAV